MKLNYLRMIQGMRAGEETDWNVYIVRCGDGTLYTGIAKDVTLRVGKHNKGTGAAYTRTRRPVKLLYSESSLSRSGALIREAEIKRWPRPKKEKFLTDKNKPKNRKRKIIFKNTSASSPSS